MCTELKKTVNTELHFFLVIIFEYCRAEIVVTCLIASTLNCKTAFAVMRFEFCLCSHHCGYVVLQMRRY